MKYLTTLETARELKVSKPTLLNWLYAGKIGEPPRDKKGYRLWSPSRVSLVRKQILDGRLHRRTVLHRQASPEMLSAYAREVRQFLQESGISADAFLRELGRLDDGFRRAARRARR
jgi:hypothetical protein